MKTLPKKLTWHLCDRTLATSKAMLDAARQPTYNSHPPNISNMKWEWTTIANSNCWQKSFDVTSQLNLNRYMNTLHNIVSTVMDRCRPYCEASAQWSTSKKKKVRNFSFVFLLNVFITETKDEQEKGGGLKWHFHNGPNRRKTKCELMPWNLHITWAVERKRNQPSIVFLLSKQADLCFWSLYLFPEHIKRTMLFKTSEQFYDSKICGIYLIEVNANMCSG